MESPAPPAPDTPGFTQIPRAGQAGAGHAADGAGGEKTAPPPGPQDAGRRTVSMTWITPFDCLTSAMVTVATLP